MWHQRCKVCGKRDKFNFQIADAVWRQIVPPAFQGRVVCLSCFDAFASAKGIKYAHALTPEIQFGGELATFTLTISENVSEPETS